MSRPAVSRADAASLILAAALLVAAMLPLSPAYPSNPNRDSGVFLYAGQALNAGAVPYRDFWDHKPPLIFFINALGLLAFPSWWGVWVLELVFGGISLFLVWRLIAPRWGAGAALLGNAVWICGLHLFSIGGRGGDLTEEYAIPLQFLAMWIWAASRDGERDGGRPALQGALASLAFLLKPPLVGIWMAIGLLVVWRRPWRNALSFALRAVAGAAVPIGAVAVWFAVRGGLPDAIDQIFHYNSVYSSGATWPERIGAARFGSVSLLLSGGALAFLYWPLAVFRSLKRPDEHRLLALAAIDLPLEVLLAATSGRGYQHYFVALLPAASVLTAAAVSQLVRSLPRDGSRVPQLTGVLAGLIVLASPLTQVRAALFRHRGYGYAMNRDAAAEFVRNAVPRSDTIYVWGSEVSVNFLSGRKSASRYIYLHPLMTAGYSDDRKVAELIADLSRNRPAVVLDTSPTEPLFLPIPPEARRQWVPWRVYTPPPSMIGAAEWIEAHYVWTATLASGWRVFVDRGRVDVLARVAAMARGEAGVYARPETRAAAPGGS